MADKRIQDLTPASSVGTADRFVLEQSGQAKSLTGQVLINDLATALDGHGGISSITYTAPVSPSLSGTLTITLADETVVTLSVTNGRGITGISKSSSGLTDTYTLSYNDGTTSTFSVDNGKEIVSVEKTDTEVLTDTYTISYNDGTEDEFSVTNGRGIDDISWSESGTQGDGMTHTGTISYNDDTTSTVIFYDGVKGDTGEQTYVWFKWAQIYPTQDSDMQNSVAPYIGIYSGFSSTAPTAYTDYAWYQYKGDKGDEGETGDYIDPVVSFGTSTAAATEPQTWYNSPSSISYAAGNFIWQKTQYTLHNAQTVQSTEKKIIGYIGQNGSGSGTVTQITFNGTAFQDDGTGNVTMTVDAADVGAIADPENKANGQVLTYDSSADEWVAATPTTGDVNTVNNVGVTAGTTNIQLYGTAIPMSSTDNTSVKDAIPLASSSTPQPLGTAAAGSGTTWARADHVHAKPSRTDLGLGTVALENVVPIAEGGTGATEAPSACANLGAYDLNRGAKIPNNSDLNDYKTIGVYYVLQSSDAATILNSPVSNGGFKLIVQYGAITASPNQRLFQWVLAQGTLQWYVRNYDGSIWSSWERMLHTGDLPLSVANGGTGATNAAGARANIGAVNIAGDTMTGNLTVQKSSEVNIYAENTSSANAHTVSLCAGGSGRGGIWDGTHSKWLVDYDKTGNLELGGVFFNKTETLTITRTENVIANATQVGRLYAYKKNGILFLNGNLSLTTGASASSFVEIASISGWSAVDGCYMCVPAQGSTGSDPVVTINITSSGKIQVYTPNAITSNVWYRFALSIPTSD